MRIVGLHKVEFDPVRFEQEMKFAAGRPDEVQLRKQFRNNHENAWIVVVEQDEEIDFDQISYPKPGPNAQAVWLEQEIPADDGKFRAAFFLHYVDPAESLYFGKTRLRFPKPSAAPKDLVELLAYESPD